MKKIFFFSALVLMAFGISCNNSATEKTGSSSSADTVVSKGATTAPVNDQADGLALITKSDCVACHSAAAKLVGPAYKDIAAKYPDNADNITRLSSTVINGGSGVWGSVPMPAHSGLSKEDAGKMIAYILSVK